MKRKINNLMDEVKFSINLEACLALLDEDGKILYNNLNGGLNGVLENLVPALKTLNVGDYQVNNFAETHLITIKVSDRLALVAESYIRESLLIFALNSIVEKLKEEFAELDILLKLSDITEKGSENKIMEQFIGNKFF
nr:hypothetical protein [Candidatus Freyarchaeota archaeon]